MHIVWINRHGSLVGGAEHYIAKTARHLRAHKVRSTFLYDPNLPTESAMFDAFDHCFPLVDPITQISDLGADLVYLHQTREHPAIAQLIHSPVPVIEFFHDHWLFCLRTHKYRTLTRETCTQTASRTACYPCLGFLERRDEFPRIRLRTIDELHERHRIRKHFAGFITGSTYMANQAIAHEFDANKVHVAPLYAEPPTNSDDNDCRENDRLLFVGAILPYKGVDVLIHALKHTSSRPHLDMVGDGALLDDMKALAENLGLRQKITFWGKLSRDRIDELYRRANALVLPSRTPESFGIVGVEAMSHGLPVISSDIGGALEWLVPGQTGLTFRINDARALGATIDTLMMNPAMAKRMGEAARQQYHAQFRPEHHIERLMHIFNNVSASGGAT